MINYAQRKYSAGVYIGKSMWYVKVPDLALTNNPTKNYNQSYVKFYMEFYNYN